jgi:hypothetical protein
LDVRLKFCHSRAWQPERAIASADHLGGTVPGAGHLIHMPSHL